MTQAPRLINSVAHLTNVTAFVGLVERVRNRSYGMPGFGVFYGFSGFGKSTAATYTGNQFRAYNVQVKSTWTAKKLCQAILTDLGIHPARNVSDMIDQVAEHLARNDRPLIIDERMRLVEFSHITRIRRKVFKLTSSARQVELPANLEVMEPVASAEENMWRSARMLKSFGAHDLAIHSTTPAVTVTDEAAQRFCQVLLKGGYLKVLRKANFKKAGKSMVRTHAIYQLVRNTGPMPPVERRVTAVFDPNLGEYVQVAGVS